MVSSDHSDMPSSHLAFRVGQQFKNDSDPCGCCLKVNFNDVFCELQLYSRLIQVIWLVGLAHKRCFLASARDSGWVLPATLHAWRQVGSELWVLIEAPFIKSRELLISGLRVRMIYTRWKGSFNWWKCAGFFFSLLDDIFLIWNSANIKGILFDVS